MIIPQILLHLAPDRLVFPLRRPLLVKDKICEWVSLVGISKIVPLLDREVLYLRALAVQEYRS